MQISDLFRRKTPATESPTTMEDSVFGRIERGKDAWMARKYFRPVRREIDIRIESGVDGPTQAQRDLYRRIEDEYDGLLGQYRAFFLEQYGPLPDGTSVEELFDSLQFQYIGLPDVTESPTIWEMVFTTDLEDHVMIPRFTDMTFLAEGWDG